MAETKKIVTALPVGTVLTKGMYPYRIEQVLGQGSYGITYKVTAQIKMGNVSQKIPFAVKENFASGYCSRMADGVTMKYPAEYSDDAIRDKEDFLAEGKRLAEICRESKNIVKVNETFEENNTAYYVMEFINGGNLCDYVKEAGMKRLPEKEAIDLLLPIIDAVGAIHSHHLLHLDIKPENIMLQEVEGSDNYEPILIDFGITLHFTDRGNLTRTSKDRSIGCSDGYAPLEQYAGVSRFAPEVDVYALGATLYYMLTGKEPIKATEINKRLIDGGLPQDISDATRNAILHAMKSLSEDRTPTTVQFKKELFASSEEKEWYDSVKTQKYTVVGNVTKSHVDVVDNQYKNDSHLVHDNRHNDNDKKTDSSISIFAYDKKRQKGCAYYRGKVLNLDMIDIKELNNHSKVTQAFNDIKYNLFYKYKSEIDFDTFLYINKDIIKDGFSIITYSDEHDLQIIMRKLNKDHSLFGVYRFIQEMQLMALCANASDDELYRYEYQNKYCEFQTGDGITEILQNGVVGDNVGYISGSKVKTISDIDGLAYIFLGSVIYIHTFTGGWQEDEILLPVFPFDIKVEIWINGRYRDGFTLIEQNSTVPCEKSEIISDDNCIIFIHLLGERYSINVSDLFGYYPASFELVARVSFNLIEFMIIDLKTKQEKTVPFRDLLNL